MDIARPLLHCKRHRVALVSRYIQKHPQNAIVVARAVAGIALVAGIAVVSRLMCSLPWQADGLIAAGAASAWVAGAEVLLGGL
jgi:hypothetical protein